MMEHDLLATIDERPDGRVRVISPGVGRWSDLPEPGTLLGPGSPIGTLSLLNRRRLLRLPERAAGRVVHVEPRHRVVAVEFGQELFSLEPLAADAVAAATGEAGAAGTGDTDGITVRAPTDGVFYIRPAPDAPPFVEPGTRVKRGQPVGLVEVMKTFNQILFDDPRFPDEAEVVEVRVGDVAEVGAGDVLIVLK